MAKLISKNNVDMKMLVGEEDRFCCKISIYFHLEKHVKRIKEKLTDAQLDILRSTSFGFLLHHQVAKWNLQFVHSVLLRQLSLTRCGDDVEEAMYFNFCGKKVKLGSSEFAIITGMKMGDYDTSLQQVKLSEDAERFKTYIRRGVVKGDPTYDDVLTRFENMDDRVTDDYAVGMALLLLYTNVVAKPPNTKIKKQMMQLALQIDEWNRFPWGSISYEATRISARNCIVNASNRDSKSYKIGGFPVVFQIFACELMPQIEASQLYKRYEIIRTPRILNWELIALRLSQSVLDKMDIWVQERPDGKCNIISPIIPTVEEIDNYGLCTESINGQNVLGIVFEEVEEEDRNGDAEENEDAKKELKEQLEKFMESVMNSIEKRCKNVEDRCNRMEEFFEEKFKSLKLKISKLHKEMKNLKRLEKKSKKETGTLQHLVLACEAQDRVVNDEVKTVQTKKIDKDDLTTVVPEEVEGPNKDNEFEKDDVEFENDDVAYVAIGDKEQNEGTLFVDDPIHQDVSKVVDRAINWVIYESTLHSGDIIASVPEPLAVVMSKRALTNEEYGGEYFVSKRARKETEPEEGSVFTYPDDMDKLIDTHYEGLENWMKKKRHKKLSSEVGEITSKDFFENILDENGWFSSENIDWYILALKKLLVEDKAFQDKRISLVYSTFEQALLQFSKVTPGENPFEYLAVKLYNGEDNHYALHLDTCAEAIFPCNVNNNHWVLIRLDMENEVVHIYDSMNTRDIIFAVGHVAEAMPKLKYLLSTKPGVSEGNKWNIQLHPDVPLQGEGSGDYGVYVLKWIEFYIFGRSFHEIEKYDPLDLRKGISTVIYAIGSRK